MIDKITLGTMTLNAGLGIPGSTIRWSLKNQFKNFKKVVVIDGDMTSEAREFYSQFSNVVAIDSPWRDSYVAQYERFAKELNDGEFGFWLDDDEDLSLGLLNTFKTWNPNIIADILRIPCILHLTEDGKNYYPAEPTPNRMYEGQWTKPIIFKKNDGLYFEARGSHVLPRNRSGKELYLPEPYYHFKTLESFVFNDVWQAFLSPQGQGYTPQEAARFAMFTSAYKSTKEFKQAAIKGLWSPPLKKFAWDNRREYSRPISRLAWTCFILYGHKMPEQDDFMTWDNVKQYVLSPETMKIYEENKRLNNKIVIE